METKKDVSVSVRRSERCGILTLDDYFYCPCAFDSVRLIS